MAERSRAAPAARRTPQGGSIKVLVDGEAATAKGSTFGLPAGVGGLTQKVVEIGGDAFRSSVAAIVSTVADALDQVDLGEGAYELGDVKFSLAFDAGGEVSLVSVAKGSITGKTGIEVSLRRRGAR